MTRDELLNDQRLAQWARHMARLGYETRVDVSSQGMISLNAAKPNVGGIKTTLGRTLVVTPEGSFVIEHVDMRDD